VVEEDWYRLHRRPALKLTHAWRKAVRRWVRMALLFAGAQQSTHPLLHPINSAAAHVCCYAHDMDFMTKQLAHCKSAAALGRGESLCRPCMCSTPMWCCTFR
jgi:hypothetical protein